MKTNALLTTLCLILCFSTETRAQADNARELKNDSARCEEFMDWGVGMFIHWSLDSELGSVISHSMVGASDDYLNRYINELPKYFNPKEYDPGEWVKLAKLAGFKYMVLTTKHHSGFCLWPTKTTDFSIANTPYKKDIVKQFVDACRKYDMKVGFYFSPEDFHFIHKQGHDIRRKSAKYVNPANNAELFAHNETQIKELFTNYGPVDVAFLDGPGPWESCFTLGTQWHFKPTNEQYKSGGTLIKMLIDIRAKGGNLLINMGPAPSGRMPHEQARRFRELGLWMFINREAIHDVRPCPVVKEGDMRFTRSKKDKGTVYVFVPQGKKQWARGQRRNFTLKSLAADGETKISVLGQNDRVVEYNPRHKPVSTVKQTEDGLNISVVRAQRIYNDAKWPNPLVVKLEGVKFRSKQ